MREEMLNGAKGSKEFEMLLSFLFEGVILINLQRDHLRSKSSSFWWVLIEF